MRVRVNNNQADRALRELKLLLVREGLFKEIKKRKCYLKPTIKRKLKREDAEKTRHKDRKRMMVRMKNILL